jgi:hypothetical protein
MWTSFNLSIACTKVGSCSGFIISDSFFWNEQGIFEKIIIKKIKHFVGGVAVAR